MTTTNDPAILAATELASIRDHATRLQALVGLVLRAIDEGKPDLLTGALRMTEHTSALLRADAKLAALGAVEPGCLAEGMALLRERPAIWTGETTSEELSP